MSRPCQAEDSDGEECDCEDFASKASQPKTCRRCLHVKKHHPQSDETISSILLKVKEEHEGQPGATMFSKLTEAKRESLEGMRPKKPAKLTSKVGDDLRLAKPVASKKGPKVAREPPSAATFKIDGIAVLPDGTQSNGTRLELADDTIPSKASLQVLINQGLAIRRDDQIEIPLAATHQEIVDILSENLSGPMAYFDMIGPTIFNDPSSGAQVLSVPGWVLLTRVRQRLEIVEVAHPTGNDVFVHRGGQKNATENRFIFISSRKPIPRNERESWRTTESLAFQMVKSQSGTDDEGSGEIPKVVKRKNPSKKRLSSVAFEESDSGSHFGEPAPTQPGLKKRIRARRADDLNLPSIYTDHIAEEILHGTVAAETVSGNAVAGPSRLFEPIDLTGSRSPSPASAWTHYFGDYTLPTAPNAPSTPDQAPAPETSIDPAYSDPVEYTYGTGPKAPRKFF
ncbi:hypothetical protein B0H11DRAFT_1907382 [Mycena galericulata]|nr:hypothetical protein B0H11DRAFT_1920860 [Mycena galericulata]KAJ7502268.1 hypothetical protein B0H11DRAFT_1907382 [Mycena galericulata]